MKNKFKISFIFAAFLSIGALVATTQYNGELFSVFAGECSHEYNHYSELSATCEEAGTKEYWVCCKCHEHFFNEPTGKKISDKGQATAVISSDDRYIAPLQHDMGHLVTGYNATYSTDGMKAHYKCSRCDTYYDENKQIRPLSAIKIKKYSDVESDILDIFNDKSKATLSTWDAVNTNVDCWTHINGSKSISIPSGRAGWRLTKQEYGDLELTFNFSNVCKGNPWNRGSIIERAILIGAQPNGDYPTGFAICVHNDFMEVLKLDGTGVLGDGWGAKAGNFSNQDITIRVIDGILYFYDASGNNIEFLNYTVNERVCGLALTGYTYGKVGVLAWDDWAKGYTTEGTVGVKNFSGNHVEEFDYAKQVCSDILSNDSSKAIFSKWDLVNTHCAAWTNGGSGDFCIESTKGTDNNPDGWRATTKTFNNFEMKVNVSSGTSMNPFKGSVPCARSFLIGVSNPNPAQDYPTGYAITVCGTDYLEVNYLDSSVQGSTVCWLNGDFTNKDFYIEVRNQRLKFYDLNHNEICGVMINPEDASVKSPDSEGIYLEHYSRGGIGILNWDTVTAKYYIKSVLNLVNKGNEAWSEQDTSKQVPVFIMAGQSNMEGNTRAWDNIDTSNYLRNFCNDNSTEYNYNTLVNTGFSNIQISYHNKYPYGDATNCSNTKDPIKGKFVDTKVGYGTSTNYFGPEIGMANELNKYVTSSRPAFLIKYAAGATGFNHSPGWWCNADNLNGFLCTEFVEYVFQNLELIKAKGYTPVIRGFCWMQGESDSGVSEDWANNNYRDLFSVMVLHIRDVFSGYAYQNIGSNIHLFDANIYTGTGSLCTYGAQINNTKLNFSNRSSNNHLYTDSATNHLNGTGYGGGDGWHYDVDGELALGKAWAQMIYNAGLLNF